MATKVSQFLNKFGEGKVFTKNDIETFFGYDTKKIIQSLIKQRTISKIKDGIYYIHNYGEDYINENQKFFIPYISDTLIMGYGSALEYYDLNEQFFNSTVLLTKKNFQKNTVEIAGYKYIYTKNDQSFGLNKYYVSDKFIYITDINRTILDCFSRPDLCGGFFNIAKAFYEANDENLIDYNKIVSYLSFYNNKQKLCKTIGFLSDAFNIKLPDGFYQFLIENTESSNYVKLKPFIAQPLYNSKWKLIVDELDNFYSLINN